MRIGVFTQSQCIINYTMIWLDVEQKWFNEQNQLNPLELKSIEPTRTGWFWSVFYNSWFSPVYIFDEPKLVQYLVMETRKCDPTRSPLFLLLKIIFWTILYNLYLAKIVLHFFIKLYSIFSFSIRSIKHIFFLKCN